MKKIILSGFILLAGLSFNRCTDILDRNPSNQASSGTMWTSESITQQGINAIYKALRAPVRSETGTYIVGGNQGLGYWGWESFGMSGQTRLDMGNFFTSSSNASHFYFSYTWKWCFTGINTANDAIVNLPTATVSETNRGKFMAEAKTLRAFFYMRLNELFGRGIGVPIYDYIVNLENNTKTQSSEEEVWDFIIQDLTDAINTPEFPNNALNKGIATGNVSKGAAYALRGKAYLLKSQSLGVDQYQLAMDDFAQVSKMGYGLFNGNYGDLFTVANEGCNEMIMSVQNVDDPRTIPSSGTQSGNNLYGNGIQKFAAPYNAGGASGGNAWTDVQLTPAIAELYEVIVDANTVKPFNWNDYITGFSSMPYEGRKVYFIRDKKIGGVEIQTSVTTAINSMLNSVTSPYNSYYLEEGNEARLLKAYTNRDPRLAASIITPYSEFEGLNDPTPSSGATLVSRWPVAGKLYPTQDGSETKSSNIPGMYTSLVANGQQYFYYLYRKFIGKGTSYTFRDFAPIDEPILRYADVLLMWAEAAIEKNDLATAKSLVKQVRDRAGVPTMDSSFANQTTARNYVRDERRREFVGEGINFFDEMRWKTLEATKFNYGAKTASQVFGGASTNATSYQWSDKFYTWPVPRTEAERNPNLKRTPGWSY